MLREKVFSMMLDKTPIYTGFCPDGCRYEETRKRERFFGDKSPECGGINRKNLYPDNNCPSVAFIDSIIDDKVVGNKEILPRYSDNSGKPVPVYKFKDWGSAANKIIGNFSADDDVIKNNIRWMTYSLEYAESLKNPQERAQKEQNAHIDCICNILKSMFCAKCANRYRYEWESSYSPELSNGWTRDKIIEFVNSNLKTNIIKFETECIKNGIGYGANADKDIYTIGNAFKFEHFYGFGANENTLTATINGIDEKLLKESYYYDELQHNVQIIGEDIMEILKSRLR
jgi:hypothetical protein